MRKALFLSAAAAIVTSVGIVVVFSCSSIIYPASYRSGVEAARRDIALGEPRLLEPGSLSPSTGMLDPESGLRVYQTGCMDTDEDAARRDGYNATMRRALRAGDLDGCSLRHKLTTRDALMARFAAEGGLPIGGAATRVAAPGGLVAIVATPCVPPRGRILELEVVDENSGNRRFVAIIEGDARVLFDHGGSTLLLKDDVGRRFLTIDLPTGEPLQGFSFDGPAEA